LCQGRIGRSHIAFTYFVSILAAACAVECNGLISPVKANKQADAGTTDASTGTNSGSGNSSPTCPPGSFCNGNGFELADTSDGQAEDDGNVGSSGGSSGAASAAIRGLPTTGNLDCRSLAEVLSTNSALTCTAPQVCCIVQYSVIGANVHTGDAAFIASALLGSDISCADPGSCTSPSLACNTSQNCVDGGVCCAWLSPVGGVTTCEKACGDRQYKVCQSEAECTQSQWCQISEGWFGYGTGPAFCFKADAGGIRVISDGGDVSDATSAYEATGG
jgi:hypothetical protein